MLQFSYLSIFVFLANIVKVERIKKSLLFFMPKRILYYSTIRLSEIRGSLFANHCDSDFILSPLKDFMPNLIHVR